jgi:hypothetical protein
MPQWSYLSIKWRVTENGRIIAALQHFLPRIPMFKNTPFDAIAKTLSESAPAFNPAAMQDAVKPAQENLKAWADLAQKQATQAQSAIAETVESIKGIKDPQAAYEIMKASAEAGMAMFAKNLQEATALSFGQFNSAVDSVEKAHPQPEAFASVAKGLKAAASTAENAIESAMAHGASMAASASPSAKAKKAR